MLGHFSRSYEYIYIFNMFSWGLYLQIFVTYWRSFFKALTIFIGLCFTVRAPFPKSCIFFLISRVLLYHWLIIYGRQNSVMAPKTPYSLSCLPFIILWTVNVMDFTPVSNSTPRFKGFMWLGQTHTDNMPQEWPEADYGPQLILSKIRGLQSYNLKNLILDNELGRGSWALDENAPSKSLDFGLVKY